MQKLAAIFLTSDKPHYPYELPKGWVWTTVGETCETHLGKMLDKLKNEGCYMSYLRNINVRWGCFDLTDVLKMRFKDDEVERYMIEKGDLVLCEGGEPGRCAIWDKANPIMFQKALHRIRCYGGVLNEYLKYVIEDYAKANKLEEYYTGSTIKHLTGESLVSILFPLPPVKEQERIVQEIQRYLSLVAIIENNKENLLAAIKQAKSKVLDLAIHGKLVPQDPNDEPAIELLKRINPKAEIITDNGHYQKLPDGWCLTILGSIGTWQSGATPSRLRKDYYGGNIPWLKTGDLNDGIITNIPEFITEKALKETSVKLNPTDSILIAMYGATIGKIGILSFPATTNQACCACLDYKIDKMYIFYFLLSNRINFVSMGGGGAQPNISKEKIVNTTFPLPSLAEQKRIVSKIEELFHQLNMIEESL